MSAKSSYRTAGPIRADQLRPASPARLAEMERRAAMEPNFSDIPRVTTEEFERAAAANRARLAAEGKERVTMFMDREVVAAFRAGGPGYQTRINDALRAYLKSGELARSPADLLDEARRALDRIVPAVRKLTGGRGAKATSGKRKSAGHKRATAAVPPRRAPARKVA